MIRNTMILGCAVAVLALTLQVMSQTGNQVSFDETCITGGVNDTLTLLDNGSFEEEPFVGEVPSGWQSLGGSPPAVLLAQPGPLRDDEGNLVTNHFAAFEDGAVLLQRPNPNTNTSSTQYQLRLCANVQNGRLIVRLSRSGVSSQTVLEVPAGGPGNFNGQATSSTFFADFSTSGVQNALIQIEFEGAIEDAAAYIDNVELVPFQQSDGTEPTPTVTPVSTPTPAPTNTPGPTVAPPEEPRSGTPTPTPTPRLSANSVRILPNPPLLVTSPDDFASRSGPSQQVQIDLQFTAPDGRPLDLLRIDPNAQIRIQVQEGGETTDAGYIRGFEEVGNDLDVSNQQRSLSDFVGGDQRFTLYFVPTRPVNSTIRIVADVEYEGVAAGRETQKEIRGVGQLVMRMDPSRSFIDPTGSFDPARNYRMGRQPGDRGFRPNLRTNLYFREVIED